MQVARCRAQLLAAQQVVVPLGGASEAPDLVFIDPPYELIMDVAPLIFARLSDVLKSKPDAIVVFEIPGELELKPDGWVMLKRLGKGARQPTVAFFQRPAPSS